MLFDFGLGANHRFLVQHTGGALRLLRFQLAPFPGLLINVLLLLRLVEIPGMLLIHMLSRHLC